MESALEPKDWGCRLEDASLAPVMADQEPFPDELLKVIRCNCQTTSKNLCKKPIQCSCRSNGIKCVAACGGYWGAECQNCGTVELFEEEENNVEEEFDNIFDNVFG